MYRKFIERVDHEYCIVERFDMKEACGQYFEERWKYNLHAMSANVNQADLVTIHISIVDQL